MIMDIMKYRPIVKRSDINFILPSIAVDIPEIDLFWYFYLSANKDREDNRWTSRFNFILSIIISK